MTFWQKTMHLDSSEMYSLYTNDKPNFYSKIFHTNTIMPGISSFFKWDNVDIQQYWWLSPKYGIDYGNAMVAPFAGPNYAYEALFPDGSHREFNLDYAKYNNTSIFGFRPYGEETYTGVNTDYTYTIVVYHKCATADNRAAYIMLCYAPRRRSDNDSILQNQNIREVTNGIYTTTSSTVYNYADSTVASSRYYSFTTARWMDVNFGKSEDYILHPLVVNGCVATDLFIIDGGMDVMPNLETITLANKNYFILNRHIAIKIN
jgi:hypothetical protein